MPSIAPSQLLLLLTRSSSASSALPSGPTCLRQPTSLARCYNKPTVLLARVPSTYSTGLQKPLLLGHPNVCVAFCMSIGVSACVECYIYIHRRDPEGRPCSERSRNTFRGLVFGTFRVPGQLSVRWGVASYGR